MADLLTYGAQDLATGEVGVSGYGKEAGDADDDEYDKEATAAEVASAPLVDWSAAPGLPTLGAVQVHQINARPLLHYHIPATRDSENPVAVSASPVQVPVLTPPCPDARVAAVGTDANPLPVYAAIWHMCLPQAKFFARKAFHFAVVLKGVTSSKLLFQPRQPKWPLESGPRGIRMFGLGRAGLSKFTGVGNADYNAAIAVGILVEPVVMQRGGAV